MTNERTENDSGTVLNADGAARLRDPGSLSEMLAILSRRPERRILFHLLHEDGPVSVESLAGVVAAPNLSPVANGGDSTDSDATES